MNPVSAQAARQVERFVERHEAAVRGYLVHLGCPPDRVEDLMQDVFLSFLSARFEERNEASTRAFLRRIAHHLFLKLIERERRAVELPDPDAIQGAWGIQGDGEPAGESLGALRECLAGLRSRALEVLRLRYGEGLLLTNVGERLGLTEAGVKSILARSKRRLRACIERRLAT